RFRGASEVCLRPRTATAFAFHLRPPSSHTDLSCRSWGNSTQLRLRYRPLPLGARPQRWLEERSFQPRPVNGKGAHDRSAGKFGNLLTVDPTWNKMVMANKRRISFARHQSPL